MLNNYFSFTTRNINSTTAFFTKFLHNFKMTLLLNYLVLFFLLKKERKSQYLTKDKIYFTPNCSLEKLITHDNVYIYMYVW